MNRFYQGTQTGAARWPRRRFPNRVCAFYRTRGQCSRGDSCPFVHEKPTTVVYHGSFDGPRFLEFLAKIADCPVEPPRDQSVKTLYVWGLNPTGIVEQDLRDRFSTYGEVESIRLVAKWEGCAFITFTTRQAAEKAMDELKSCVDLKGHKRHLQWDHTHKPVAKWEGCAFITFTTRQAAEKAMDELKSCVDLKGHKRHLQWDHTHKPELFTTIGASSS